MKQYRFYLITGSQHLYGDSALAQVDADSKAVAESLNACKDIPCSVVWLPCVKTAGEISAAVEQANADEACAGVMVWMHTFSPSKMWIAGLSALRKPYLHIHTQFNRDIPWDTIDMDFMNLNQSAHGDREHGYIAARMRLPRRVIAGHWQDPVFLNETGRWMRAAAGIFESRRLKVMRISDNMRSVAVTEGDKIEAQLRLGWQVDHYGTGDLAAEMEKVSDAQAAEQLEQYRGVYHIEPADEPCVLYQAKIEAALKNMLERGGYGAFHTNFEDLEGLRQLPGLAVQDLMRLGYGFAAEGDWKTAALVRTVKLMSAGLSGAATFIEDYTYHLEPGNEMVLGAHMLEVCPSVSVEKPAVKVCPLGIGGKEPPARAVFKARAGKAVIASLVDMGDRLRLIVNRVDCVEQPFDMPKLPVAGILWKPLPSLKTAAEAWILSGGAHHSALSYDLGADELRDFAEIAGIEFICIDEKTDIQTFRKELALSDAVWRRR